MNEAKNLFKNTSWMMISQIITSICAFIWTILIARCLGVNDFGIISFALSFSLIISILLDLGIGTFSIRDISRNNTLASEYLGKLIPLKIFLSICILCFSLLILNLMDKNYLTITVTMIFVIETIFASLSGLLQSTFQAFGKIKYQALGNIINSLLLLLFVLIAIYLKLGLIFVATSYVFTYIIMLIYLSVNTIHHITTPKFEIDMKFCKNAIKLSVPFALTGFFYTIYFSIDTVMLSYFTGNYATGIYNASYKIISVLTTFFPVYQVVVFPLMSKLFKGSEDLLKLSFIKSIKYLLLIIFPITFGIELYANPLVTLIYGNDYLVAGPVMQILVWTVVFLFVNGACSTLLNASNKEISVTKIYCFAALFNIMLNIILIPIYSYHGAAIATVLSEIIICYLMIHVVRKTPYCPNLSIFKDIIKIILSSIIMISILYFSGLNMWIGIIIGIIIYSICILLFKTLDTEDKKLFHEIFN